MLDGFLGDSVSKETLAALLRHKNYLPFLNYLETDYGVIFRHEVTGATFEGSIDWCAVVAGTVPDARRILVLLFKRFYGGLPAHAKAELAYVGAEIGYLPLPRGLDRGRDIWQWTIIPYVSAAGWSLLGHLQQLCRFACQRWSRLRARFFKSLDRPKSLPAYLAKEQQGDRMLSGNR